MRVRFPKLCRRYVDISVIASSFVTPSFLCHAGCSFAAKSTKSLNPLLPNRESPCSSAGLRTTTSSTLSRISRMIVTAGLGASLRLEIGVSWTEAARPKTKARRREYVGEARKRSWSAFERMRRLGFVKVNSETSGGGGRAGVSGTGSGFAGGGCRRRGWSFGRRSLRFGMLAACLSCAGTAGAVFSILGDILMVEICPISRSCQVWIRLEGSTTRLRSGIIPYAKTRGIPHFSVLFLQPFKKSQRDETPSLSLFPTPQISPSCLPRQNQARYYRIFTIPMDLPLSHRTDIQLSAQSMAQSRSSAATNCQRKQLSMSLYARQLV